MILELQRDVLDQRIPASALLRKALVIATKLGLSEFAQWISMELDGYPLDADYPEYRFVEGEVKMWNPVRGWIPVVFEDPKLAKAATRRPSSAAIAEIEAQLAQAQPGGRMLMPFTKEAERQLQIDTGADFPIGTLIDPTQLEGVLNGVRNAILNWTLQLESDGVLGDGMVFSTDERDAVASRQYVVNNFFGPVSGAQIQQFTKQSTQMSQTGVDVEVLKTVIAQFQQTKEGLDLDTECRQELDAELATLAAQAESPKPKHGIVKESLQSLRRIIESAGGSAAGSILLRELVKLLGT